MTEDTSRHDAQKHLQDIWELFGGALHEFRTPISITKTAAYLITRKDDPDYRERKAQQIIQQQYHIETLMDGMYFLIRLTAEEIKPEPTDVNSLLSSVMKNLREQFDSKAQHITAELDTQLPHIHADKSLLENAFHQILQNASKFTPEQGNIRVQTRFDDAMLSVIIADNGAGIDPRNLPHIFKPFHYDFLSGSGNGLGLTIALRCIEAHHGKILVESEEGKGSAFTIELPIIKTPEQEKESN